MLGYDPVSGKSTFENKMAKNQMALDLMKMFPQVPGGIEKLFGENAQFADLGGVLGGMTGQDTADTWAQKGTWQNQKDLQAMQNQGQLDAIYAQATAKASADRAQKANLAGVSKQVMDMLDAGNFNDAIDMLVTNGIDPEGFFKGVNGGQTLYPPTQMPTADEIGLSNKYGVSPQAAQLIGQLGKVGVGKEAVTSMIEQAKKDPSFQNLTSNDWAGIYDWANQTKANTLGVPTGGYRMGQYQGNPILDSIIRGQPVNQSGNGPVKGAQRRITPYGFPSVR
jgi:hypothetical protein